MRKFENDVVTKAAHAWASTCITCRESSGNIRPALCLKVVHALPERAECGTNAYSGLSVSAAVQQQKPTAASSMRCGQISGSIKRCFMAEDVAQFNPRHHLLQCTFLGAGKGEHTAGHTVLNAVSMLFHVAEQAMYRCFSYACQP